MFQKSPFDSTSASQYETWAILAEILLLTHRNPLNNSENRSTQLVVGLKWKSPAWQNPNDQSFGSISIREMDGSRTEGSLPFNWTGTFDHGDEPTHPCTRTHWEIHVTPTPRQTD